MREFMQGGYQKGIWIQIAIYSYLVLLSVHACAKVP
jgi:hypothetical protein